MDDFTSGFNITSNMTNNSRFNSMIGFTEAEVREMFTYYKSEGTFKGDIEQVIHDIKPWYDNYCFSKSCLDDPSMYNSDMVLYFLDEYTGTGRYPDNMLI